MAMRFPAADWLRASPSDVGWDESALEDAITFALERRTSSFAVCVGGSIIAERYREGSDEHTARDIASAQKSVVSFLVGMAQEQGLLSIDDPVSRHLGDGWTRASTDQERSVTVRHLVTMTSGLTDEFAFEAQAGSVWFYNNPAYHQTQRVLEVVYGTGIDDLSRTQLFDKLGMDDTKWLPREQMLDPNGKVMFGLHTTAQDMLRFGLCVLAGGTWDGVPVLADREYLRASTDSSQDLNPAYGYLWWLNGKARTVMPGPAKPVVDGPLVPTAPPDMFAALGAMDQKIYVVPSLDCVVARQGGPGSDRPGAAGSDFDRTLWDRLSKAAPAGPG